jgi:hypothetical protein
MPVKIFTGSAGEAAALEASINEWMGKLEPGAVRQINAGSGALGTQQVVITIWYTELKDKN